MPKKRVAIVGGGPAGLSAAYHLVQSGVDLDITVYQMGWRLGGKGATGRDSSKANRIEEHGIHLFSRMYFDTWPMMKTVYDAVGNGSHPCLPVQSLEEAFEPSNTTYPVENVSGCWVKPLNAMTDAEGDPWDESIDISKSEIVLRLLDQLVERGRAGETKSLGFEDFLPYGATEKTRASARDLHGLFLETSSTAHVQRDQKTGDAAVMAEFESDELQTMMVRANNELQAGRLKLQELQEQVEGQQHIEIHRTLCTADMGIALFNGLVRARFWSSDFDLDDLDGIDYRDWLRKSEASEHTVDSASVLSVANIVFAYPEGDTTRAPVLSAASWLNWMLRSVLGHGAYFQFFAAGTGETVTLPLYLYLKDEGVRFEFFHRLRGVTTSGGPGNRSIDALDFERQATVASGSYDPIVTIPNRSGNTPWCVWPNEPKWRELANGDVNQANQVDYEAWETGEDSPAGSGDHVLTKGQADGFDYVVWAIPNSMIPLVGDAGMQDEWAKTVEQLPTTATQAIQIWLTEDTNGLGWPRGGLPLPTSRYASSSFPNPLSGMVAFDSLLAYESWPSSGPKGLVYFCGQIQPWPGQPTPAGKLARVRTAASATLRVMGNFWTGARPPEGSRPDAQAIDFAYLYDDDATHQGEERLSFQYARANVRPTEAYVQAPPGSTYSEAPTGTPPGRRYAWDSGFDNLVVAGDWMYNGLNLGSFESAVSGGKAAAFALTGRPKPLRGMKTLTFLHPRARKAAKAAKKSGRVPMITP